MGRGLDFSGDHMKRSHAALYDVRKIESKSGLVGKLSEIVYSVYTKEIWKFKKLNYLYFAPKTLKICSLNSLRGKFKKNRGKH